MSKMGISDVASYRGARLFEAVGLDRRLLAPVLRRHAFGDRRHRPRPARARRRSSAWRPPMRRRSELENPGFYKFRKGGEPHATDPDVVAALQESVSKEGMRARTPSAAPCGRATRSCTSASRRSSTARSPIEPRDLLELVPTGEPVPLEEVEPVEEIVRRFSGGGDVARRALRRGARDARDRAQPSRRALELRRGRRGSVALPHRAQLADQADRLGALRRHRRVRGVRGRAADQGRAGLEARRGRPDPGAQGDRGDRAAAQHPARASR